MTTRAAVLIPIYSKVLSRAESFSVDRTLAILSGYDVIFIGPHALKSHLEDMAASRARSGTEPAARTPSSTEPAAPGTARTVSVKTFPNRRFTGTRGYNHLLKSRRFYAAFSEYDYLLIVQTDALVLYDRLEEWCSRGWSYVGAPIFSGLTEPRQPLRFLGVGNGGFSLRRTEHFLRVLSKTRHIPNPYEEISRHPDNPILLALWRLLNQRLMAFTRPPFQAPVNEDMFWGMLVPRAREHGFFKVPTPEEAADFAFDAAPEHLHQLNGSRLPFGCHAWHRYAPVFWRDVLRRELGIDPDS